MGRIIITEFISMDGVMEAPGGDDGFVRGQWTFEFDRGERADKFKHDETMNAHALLLGRRTYSGFSQAWPKMQGAFADRFNTMPKYVVSSTLSDPDWGETTVITGDVEGEIAQLKESLDGDLIVHGSRQLAQTLIEAGLADQLNLMVFPVVLGVGTKLFADSEDSKKWRLASSETSGEGILLLVYERAG